MEFGGIRPPVTAAASAAPVQLTPEEEALKRNTDCVYFLASPLTCKKGNECEYRHSEAARMNPRDCFYWLHGTCMNPKCAFRHPPLDGLVSRVPLKPPVPQPVAPVNKVAPCYYFQKGNCMKGDRCPFMHGPATRVSPSSQSTQKKGPSPPMPQKVDHNPKFIANNKPVSNPPMPVSNISKSLPKAGVATSYKPMLVNNNNSLPDEELSEYHQSQFNVNRGAQVQSRERIFQSDERTQDSRDRDEFLGESSPGFDVLVDHDEEEDSRYVIPTEDNHHHNPYQTDETYLLEHDYEILPRIERERYAVLPEQDYQPEFDPYERKRPRRESSRDLDRSSRRRPLRDEAEDEIDGSDLRFRLMNKQRRVNGNGSDKRDHHRREERSHHHRREERHVEERRGTRLEGRIKIPERRPDSMHMEDRERRRNFRVSPARPPPVRQFEAKRPRSSEFVPGVGRPGFRRGEEDFSNFAGPKSLTELKGGKSGGEDRGRNRERDREREREPPLDFEGPKPLSVILKRKREAAGNGNNQIEDSTPKEEEAVKEEEVEEGMINENVGTEEKVTEEAAYDQNEYVEEEEYIEEGEEGGINGEEYQEGGEEEYIEEEEEDEDDFARKLGVVFT